MSGERVVDAFVTPVFWPDDQLPAYARDALDMFGAVLEEARGMTPGRLVELMDEHGVDHAVLNGLDGLWPDVLAYVEAYPDRFSFSVEVDPRRGMQTVREVDRAIREHGAVLVRMVPFVVGLAPSDRVYYPVFAKCAELGVPVALNCGIPAPPMPAEVQHPLHLDEVLRFFPELTVVMQHGADPWWDVAIRLLMKFPNLYLMTSAWSPRRLPESLLRFMDGRGRGKVMFGSDHPVLSFGRCLREARDLGLAPESLAAYLGGAADRALATPARTA